jgi:hypothetical protein
MIVKGNKLENPWVLAGLIIAINAVLSLIIEGIFELLQIQRVSALYSLAGIVAAAFVGMLYVRTFQQSMPKPVKLKVTWIIIVFQVFAILVLGLTLGLLSLLSSVIMIVLTLVLIAVYGLVTYQMLGIGKYYVQNVQMQNKPIKKKK